MAQEIMASRPAGANMIPCGKTIAWSSLTKDNGSIPLPRARVDWILISAKYNVTDAGISAGETFFGAMDRIQIGESGARVVTIESDEFANFAAFTNGFATGTYNDPLPTTATDAYAYILIKGPFQLSGMSNPEIFAEIGAITDEWGAASAFTCELSACVLLSDVQDGPGYYYERQYRPTSTRQELLGLGPGLVEDVLLVNGSASTNTSRVTVDYGDGRSPLSFDRPYNANEIWSAHSRAVSTTGMLFENLDMAVSSRRQIVLTNGTTDTVLAFIRNIVSV